MQKPKRGEVWRFRLSGAMGTEMGAKKEHSGAVRLCVVVSDDRFNARYRRLSIVPLTSRAGRQGIMSAWSVFLNSSDYPWLEIDDVVDCGQPWTVYAIGSRLDDRDDIRSNCLGKLHQQDIERVEDALLNVLTGKNIRYEDIRNSDDDAPFPFRAGQVLEASFLNINDGKTFRSQCLLVSDPMFEEFRQKNGLQHCTVVALVSEQYINSLDPDIIATVHIEKDDQSGVETKLALCRELYTIDYGRRKAVKFGRVRSLRQIDDVRKVLRNYLHLPLEEAEEE